MSEEASQKAYNCSWQK